MANGGVMAYRRKWRERQPAKWRGIGGGSASAAKSEIATSSVRRATKWRRNGRNENQSKNEKMKLSVKRERKITYLPAALREGAEKSLREEEKVKKINSIAVTLAASRIMAQQHGCARKR